MVGSNETSNTYARHDDVGFATYCLQVFCRSMGMRARCCCIATLANEQDGLWKSSKCRTTNDYNLLTLGRNFVALKQTHHTKRCARCMPRKTTHEAAHAALSQTINIFLGRQQCKHRLCVKMLRQRQLHQNSVHRWVCCKSAHFCFNLFLCCIIFKMHANRNHSGLLCFLVLACHINMTWLIATDQHRCQAHCWRTSSLNLFAQTRNSFVAQVIAIHQDGATRRALVLSAHERPTISPFSSKSMIAAAGFVPRPGSVRMSPQIGYTKPAPTDARTSRTLSV